jgi:hypothetical protein
MAEPQLPQARVTQAVGIDDENLVPPQPQPQAQPHAQPRVEQAPPLVEVTFYSLVSVLSFHRIARSVSWLSLSACKASFSA